MTFWAVGAVVGGSLLSAYSSNKAAGQQADAAKQAAQTQAEAGKYATDAQIKQFDTINGQQAPWRDAGTKAVNQLSSLTNSGALANTVDPNFHSNDFKFDNQTLKNNLAPNYDFMLNQGLGAINNQNSVTGGLVGGNALKGINDYAQNYAQNGYQQAFNNALTANNTNYNQNFQNQQQSFNNVNTNQSNIFNRLASIAGLGQTANGQSAIAGTQLAGNVGNIATNTAGNIGSAQLYGGAAQAAGTNGVANSIANGLNNAAGWYMSGQRPRSAYGGNSLPSSQQESNSGGYDFIGPSLNS